MLTLTRKLDDRSKEVQRLLAEQNKESKVKAAKAAAAAKKKKMTEKESGDGRITSNLLEGFSSEGEGALPTPAACCPSTRYLLVSWL
jgi:hypothetical protein